MTSKFLKRVWEIVGSCNGLICIRRQSPMTAFELILWNPYTITFRQIPQPTSLKENPYLSGIDFFGFGCGSESSNGYKVVLGELMCGRQIRIYIFALQSKSCSIIDCEDSGFHFDGYLHWIGNPDDDGRMTIIMFNLDI